MDAAAALQKIGEMLKVEGADLEELTVHGQHISRNRGFFQRIRRLPGQLLGDGDTEKPANSMTHSTGQKSIAMSWATFLLTDEADAAANTNGDTEFHVTKP